MILYVVKKVNFVAKVIYFWYYLYRVERKNMMIDLFNRFDKTILYKDGNNLENKINFLRYKLDNCL